MPEIVKQEFFGFSGSKIFLIQNGDSLFVRKLGNISRNIERMLALSEKYRLPKIYKYSKNEFDCEYIQDNLDMKSYLLTYDITNLSDFLIDFLNSLSNNVKNKDYTQVYINKLEEITFCEDIIFTKTDLLNNLPKIIPSSEYFGDLTLENILYSKKEGFVLIDCQTVEYDSFIFDIAKLRQDLESKWFLRNNNILLDTKLQLLQQKILDRFPQSNNDYLLILMLLRAYRYSSENTLDRKFLISQMNRLWQKSIESQL